MTEHDIIIMVAGVPRDEVKKVRDGVRREANILASAIESAQSNLRDTYATITQLQRRAYLQGIDLD